MLHILCYWWRNCDVIDTYTSMMGISTEGKYLIKKIRNMEQSDCLQCFSTKTGVLVDWRKKHWSKNDNTGTVRTVRGRPLPKTSNNNTCAVIFLISPPTFQFLSGNILSNRFAPYLIFSQRFHQVLMFSPKSHHWRIGINLHHDYVINSKEYVTNGWTVVKHL